MLDAVRWWTGVEEGAALISWGGISRKARDLGIRAHGHFKGEPGAPDARAGRVALRVIKAQVTSARAAVMIRDADHQPERLQGLNQARDDADWPFAVVIGVAYPKRECWLLAAFEPGNEHDLSSLGDLRQDLGFNPCAHSHKLTAKKPSAKRNAKRVVDALFGRNPADAENGVNNTPLERLRERGSKNGLADYLREVEERLVPLFE